MHTFLPPVEELSPLVLRSMPGSETMELAAAYSVRVGHCTYTAPQGMISDGGSIPRFFWRVIDPPLFSRMRPGFLIHDAAYKGLLRCTGDHCGWQPVEKSEADSLLYWLALWNGCSPWKAALVYRAVVWFGRRAWVQSHAEYAGLRPPDTMYRTGVSTRMN